MPVVKVPSGSTLRLQLRVGTDESGNPVFRNKSLNNVKATAGDQDLFDAATALSGLQSYPLTAVSRIDSAGLLQG